MASIKCASNFDYQVFFGAGVQVEACIESRVLAAAKALNIEFSTLALNDISGVV